MRSTRRSRAGAVFDAPLVSAATTAYPSIADRANGGTSIGDTTSAAATRPAAASSGTRSTRVIGRTEASSRRRASSSVIVDANGLIGVRSPVRLLHHVSELRDDEPFHRQTDSRLGSRQRDDDAARRKTGACPAHHRCGANLLEAQHPEELSKAVEPFVQETADR